MDPRPDGVRRGECAARRFPYNDQPSRKARHTLGGAVPTGPRVISNGVPPGEPRPAEPGGARRPRRENAPTSSHLAFPLVGHDVRRTPDPGITRAADDRRLPRPRRAAAIERMPRGGPIPVVAVGSLAGRAAR